MWLCAVFGAAGILVAIWNPVWILPAPVAAASESMLIDLNVDAHAKVGPVSYVGSSVPSFGDQKDLWAFAKQAEASGDVAFKYEGYIAAAECAGLLKLSDHYNKQVERALRAGHLGPYLALADLNERCAGFAAVSPAQGIQLVRTLKAQVASSNSILSVLTANKELSDTERQAVLRSAGPAAMELVLPRVQAVLEPGAVLLAMCDLGKACGPDSFGALLYCLQTSQCGQALWADAAEEYGPEEWQVVQLERDRIVRLMKAGDFQALFEKS
jgi:hypothetical protein